MSDTKIQQNIILHLAGKHHGTTSILEYQDFYLKLFVILGERNNMASRCNSCGGIKYGNHFPQSDDVCLCDDDADHENDGVEAQ